MSTKTSPQSVNSGAPTTTTTHTTVTKTKSPTSSTIADIAAASSSHHNNKNNNSNTTTTTTGTIAAAMQAVKIKKELPSDEIKEFAENTMNELLGWYGFDGVDRLDLSTKTSRLLQSAAAANANNNNNNNNNSHHSLSQHHMEKRRNRSRAVNFYQLQQHDQHMRNLANNNNNNNNNNSNNSNNNNNSNNSTRKIASNCNSNTRLQGRVEASSRGSGERAGGGGAGGGGGGDSTTSDHDTRSSREEDSKSPHSAGKTTMEEKIDFQNCCWCRRPIPENAPEFLTTSDGPRYCSESCFTQSRRASFKKAKTCDWCKHVRHAVSYVDFQDGASQLQFCSDKCLNQYKMQIFCKETQAHLDMNPHLRDQGMEAAAAGNGAGLITPDLWLRNCRSRSASPASTVSVSPGPPMVMLPSVNTSSSSPRITPPHCSSAASAPPASSSNASAPVSTHKPLISVAPVSKLMSKSAGLLAASNRQSPKHNRKKRPLRACVSGNSSSGDLLSSLKHHGGISRAELSSLNASAASTGVGMLSQKSKALLNANVSSNLRTSPGHLGPSSNVKASASTLSQFAGSSVQDLHMSVPPLSPMLEQNTHPHGAHPLPQVPNMAATARSTTNIPPAFFATPPGGGQGAPATPHAAFPPHPPFLGNPAAAAALLPRFLNAAGGVAGGFAGMPQPHPHLLQPPDMNGLGLGALLGAPPPVTVMVPYPIIIPLPIPIPVPLPVMDFYKAHLTPEERAKLKAKEEQESKCRDSLTKEATSEQETPAAECRRNETTEEEPLDFTKSKEESTREREIPQRQLPTNDPEDSMSLEQPVSEETEALTPTPISTPHSEEATSPLQVKATHCIVRADEEPDSTLASKHELLAEGRRTPDERDDEGQQKLPKFKITRLQTKRTLIQTKETSAAECSRPLRKRKRIIDCDFQKIALKETEADRDENAEMLESAEATATCNNGTKAMAASSSSSSGKKL